MKKRLLSLALALVMVLALFPMTARANDTEAMQSNQYTLENGVLTIHDGVTEVKTLVDAETDLETVEKITQVIIPSSVTTIADNAFRDHYTGLTSVTIPESVTTIGACAFYGCTSLTNLYIPDSVTTMDETSSTFGGCTSLTNIAVGENNPNYVS